ncbi:putative toxin-antitoxin system toxin component, PIN family [Candidatus Falkowbacteria bacterium RBG_13_39_14]|uniref:Putative toxin-antitoxin system toxin component, PIN family n=1 Tax=Candidatus Falkowbacteria bacterium RBG_13_39_14 TaxID=1797985 RepID=A0A1F5S696_9BACT|nr:MAG: putative toxin-antitoxin system toxin component, PIN family [Candidatus Falkowbacteria bacterium RBG_13_39_14]
MLFRKQLGIFYDLINDEFVIPYFIETTFCELQNLIQSNKFKPALEKILLSPEDIINAIGDKSVILPDPASIPKIINDPSDNTILACAVSARANFIISGDSHLLKLKSFQNIPILTPRKFLTSVHPAPIRRN